MGVFLNNMSRRKTTSVGYCFDLKVSGAVRRFSWSKLLSSLVAYSFVAGAVQSLIVFAAVHVMPRKKSYKELLIQESNDFNYGRYDSTDGGELRSPLHADRVDGSELR